ncbi:MAG: hypothetical protein K5756_00975 [Clostridiales bacterium]|nr:hypothetical protein [Clostridiales bacterium]
MLANNSSSLSTSAKNKRLTTGINVANSRYGTDILPLCVILKDKREMDR